MGLSRSRLEDVRQREATEAALRAEIAELQRRGGDERAAAADERAVWEAALAERGAEVEDLNARLSAARDRIAHLEEEAVARAVAREQEESLLVSAEPEAGSAPTAAATVSADEYLDAPDASSPHYDSDGERYHSADEGDVDQLEPVVVLAAQNDHGDHGGRGDRHRPDGHALELARLRNHVADLKARLVAEAGAAPAEPATGAAVSAVKAHFEDRVAELNAEIHRLREAAAAAQATQDARTERLEALTRETKRVGEEAAAARTAEAHLRERVAELAGQVEALTAANAAAVEARSEAEQARAAALVEARAAQEALARAEAHKSALVESHEQNGISAAAAAVAAVADPFKARVGDLEAQVARHVHTIAGLRADIASMEHRAVAAEEASVAHLAALAQAELEHDSMEEQLEAAAGHAARLDSLSAEVAHLQAGLEEQMLQNDGLVGTNNVLTKDNHDLRARAKALHRDVEERAAREGALRATLSEAQIRASTGQEEVRACSRLLDEAVRVAASVRLTHSWVLASAKEHKAAARRRVLAAGRNRDLSSGGSDDGSSSSSSYTDSSSSSSAAAAAGGAASGDLVTASALDDPETAHAISALEDELDAKSETLSRLRADYAVAMQVLRQSKGDPGGRRGGSGGAAVAPGPTATEALPAPEVSVPFLDPGAADSDSISDVEAIVKKRWVETPHEWGGPGAAFGSSAGGGKSSSASAVLGNKEGAGATDGGEAGDDLPFTTPRIKYRRNSDPLRPLTPTSARLFPATPMDTNAAEFGGGAHDAASLAVPAEVARVIRFDSNFSEMSEASGDGGGDDLGEGGGSESNLLNAGVGDSGADGTLADGGDVLDVIVEDMVRDTEVGEEEELGSASREDDDVGAAAAEREVVDV